MRRLPPPGNGFGRGLNYAEGSRWVLNPWREVFVWGLSALLLAETDSRRTERIRLLADQTVTKSVSTNALECTRAWT